MTMRNHWRALCALSGLLAAPIAGCGDEAVVPAQDRCAELGYASFGGGSINVSGGKPGALEVVVDKASGFVQNQTIVVRFPNASLAEGKRTLLLRFYTTESGEVLLERISRALESGPLTLNIADATAIKAGSNNVSTLDGYDCAFSQGALCAQLAVDRTGDGLINDEDEVVFNAKGGTVTFEKIDGLSSIFRFDYSLNLGANIFDREDMTTSNAWAGCVDSGYRSVGNNRWDLE